MLPMALWRHAVTPCSLQSPPVFTSIERVYSSSDQQVAFSRLLPKVHWLESRKFTPIPFPPLNLVCTRSQSLVGTWHGKHRRRQIGGQQLYASASCNAFHAQASQVSNPGRCLISSSRLRGPMNWSPFCHPETPTDPLMLLVKHRHRFVSDKELQA